MICDAGRSIGCDDGAAAQKAVLFQQVLHHGVMLMGVRPEVRAKALAEIKAPAGKAGERTIAPQPVNGGVGIVIAPRTVGDDPIGGVLAQNADEYAVNHAVLRLHVAVAVCNVAGNHAVGIPRLPLVCVAVGVHKRLGGGIDRPNAL